MPETVSCIVKGDSDKYSDCRCVTEIQTNRKRYSREQAHRGVDNGKIIWVEGSNSRAKLLAAEREGTKYVRTEPNDTEKDNLLTQPEC